MRVSKSTVAIALTLLAGAANAALYAISLLAITDNDLADKLDAFREIQKDTVMDMSLPPNNQFNYV